MNTIVSAVDMFVTDWGTYSRKSVQDELRKDPDNRMLNAASDMLDITLRDHQKMQERRAEAGKISLRIRRLMRRYKRLTGEAYDGQ